MICKQFPSPARLVRWDQGETTLRQEPTVARTTMFPLSLALATVLASGVGERASAMPVSATDPGVVRVAAQVLSPGSAWEARDLLGSMEGTHWTESRLERGGVVVVNRGTASGDARARAVRVEVLHLAN
jgi:hypothetical protein